MELGSNTSMTHIGSLLPCPDPSCGVDCLLFSLAVGLPWQVLVVYPSSLHSEYIFLFLLVTTSSCGLIGKAICVNNLGWQSSTLPACFWTTVWQAEKRAHSNNKFQFTVIFPTNHRRE